VFRGATFTGHADFREARFHGVADFRRVTFGDDAVFRGAEFDGDVDFGTRTTAKLTGATTGTNTATRRKWPDGWSEEPDAGRARLVHLNGINPAISHRYTSNGNHVASSDVKQA
jgi:hypothetical protein